MNKPPVDPSIPTLTEIIAPPSVQSSTPAGAVTPPAPVARVAISVPPLMALDAAAPMPEKPAGPASPEQWEMLELKLAERILQQLQGRIDFILEHRVRDSLADVLETAVTELAADIRGGLQNTLQEVIGRAVAQEIAKLQSGKIT